MVNSEDTDWYFEEDNNKESLVHSMDTLRNTTKSKSKSIKRAKRCPTAGVGVDLVT